MKHNYSGNTYRIYGVAFNPIYKDYAIYTTFTSSYVGLVKINLANESI